MNMKLAVLALLLLAPALLAGSFLPVVSKNISEGKSERFPIGTIWADVRAYQLNISTVYASCSGNGSARTCGPCPTPNELAIFIVTFWNGTAVTTPAINESGEYTATGQFKIRVARINETAYVDNTGTGQCNYMSAFVTTEFYAYVQCRVDSDCPSGLGCTNATYTCVTSECSTNAQCAEDEACTYHQCYTVPRKSCGEIRNHTWVDFKCCSDAACPSDERCMRNACREYRYCANSNDCYVDEYCSNSTRHCELVENTSACGAYIGHRWENYACCSDAACGSGQRCVNHACIACASDADCADDSVCRNATCQKLTGCGLIANHAITPYECCANDDCFAESACVDHGCRPIPCPCGDIVNHTCIPCATPTPTPAPSETPTPAPTSTPANTQTPAPTPAPTPASACPGMFVLLAAGLVAAAWRK